MATTTRTISQPTGTAVVVGGSMAGLLAAAALSPAMDRVVVLERDTLPAGPALRRGTPQAWHAHGVLAAGRDAMAALLPGLTQQLIEQGATSEGDIGRNTRWWLGGGLLAPTEVGSNGVAVSRVVLEAAVRERVRALPNMVVRDAVHVLGLLAAGRRLTGVRVRGRADRAAAEILTADLVVDARAVRAVRPRGCKTSGSRRPPRTRCTWAFATPADGSPPVRTTTAGCR